MEPKYQNKWELIYNKKVMWEVVWKNLNLLRCKQKIIQFQWKCIHFIVYIVDYRKWENQMDFAIFVKITQKLYNIYFFNA
jgi:DMSO/TMAO reductase YedYZ heme-binding membrane subunit